MRFNFGENWQSYAETALTGERVAAARADFRRLFAQVGLEGKSFLDIGFGQGLSICFAAEQGAVCQGIDLDPDNLKAFSLTFEHFDLPQKPQLHIGSILDSATVQDLSRDGGFDVVHSWGVLHHTGDMALALRNASALTAPDGHLVIAIYRSHWSAPFWSLVKRLYNHSPAPVQRILIWLSYGLIYVAKWIVTRQHPHHKARGMDFYHDVVDWVGGYPYEHANSEEIVASLAAEFKLVDFIEASVPTGCNQYVFRRLNG